MVVKSPVNNVSRFNVLTSIAVYVCLFCSHPADPHVPDA